MRSVGQYRPLIGVLLALRIGTISGVVFLALEVAAASAAELVNPGFEGRRPDGGPAGWTVLTGLDPAQYGPPDYDFDFGGLQPTVVKPGRGGRGHALGFPVQGTWRCGVSHHEQGRIDGELNPVIGSRRGKAAAYQLVSLDPGRYRFGAHLRTADGDAWSGSFSLGVATNGATRYAHDESTGIDWSDIQRGMRGDPAGDYTEWGEWQWHTTEPFTIADGTPVSVWVRFNYVNQHAMNARWEVDDAAIVPVQTDDWSPETVFSGAWDWTDPPILSDLADIRLDLNLRRGEEWRRLEIRFRETADQLDGYVLSITSDGGTELRSIADGFLHAGEVLLPESGFYMALILRSQYLRVNLPGECGFEARAIGPADGTVSIHVDPPGSAAVQARMTTAPPELPAIPVPVPGEFEKVYDPSAGEEGRWYINDHCVIRDTSGVWHMFGITHAEPANPLDEDFFAHATSNELLQSPWRKHPSVCSVNEVAGEAHVWAPHIVEKDGTYHMFYCGGSQDHDSYQMNLRTSSDLFDWTWYPANPLFTDIGDARDPMVLELESGRYLMYYTRPSDLDRQWSSVAVRESDDLLHWSEPSLALVTHERCRYGRRAESPFVFRYEDGEETAYYLSATGLGGGYRSTPVWRSVNPRRFHADHTVTRIDAHAPEWIQIDGEPPAFVTHCGWGQGGFHIAPVRWEHRPWRTFGLLVVRQETGSDHVPSRIMVRKRDDDRTPYRVFVAKDPVASYPLPPGRYRVSAQRDGGKPIDPVLVEVVADERVYVDLE